MSAANKIAEAPERIWITGESCLWSSSRHFHASNLDHSNDDGTCDYPEYVRADLADGWEAEKARADALAQENARLLGLLREGADLLSEEADALKAGIGGEGEWETCADPVDQPTVQAIREIEEWIAKVAAMQPRAGSTP